MQTGTHNPTEPRGSLPDRSAPTAAEANVDLASLLPLIYDELRAMAGNLMRRERPGHTLQSTALVHEVFVRLLGGRTIPADDRAQFFAAAAHTMRQVLVDYARRHKAAKRQKGRAEVSLDEVSLLLQRADVDLLALDMALQRLAQMDALQARLVELRFFAGLTIEEVATALRISPATVKREWTLAKAWLHRELGDD